MKKFKLIYLLILGMSGSLIAAQDNTAKPDPKSPSASTPDSKTPDTTKSDVKPAVDPSQDPSYGNLGYHLMTEDELSLEVNDEGMKLFQSLDAEGKALALKVASQRCAQTNFCRGLNACATDKHKCAGEGECKGQGKCGFADKNLAVKVVAKKMAQKRADLTK